MPSRAETASVAGTFSIIRTWWRPALWCAGAVWLVWPSAVVRKLTLTSVLASLQLDRLWLVAALLLSLAVLTGWTRTRLAATNLAPWGQWLPVFASRRASGVRRGDFLRANAIMLGWAADSESVGLVRAGRKRGAPGLLCLASMPTGLLVTVSPAHGQDTDRVVAASNKLGRIWGVPEVRACARDLGRVEIQLVHRDALSGTRRAVRRNREQEQK